MAWNVTVLTPNGRRHTARYSTDATLLQVLEQTCAKHDFKAEEYDLTHHNRVMDTTSTLRFSGLPNNATLEMCPAKKVRTESEVILGLQLESGERKMGTFKPSMTIFEILSNLVPDQCEVSLNPVVIYMRKEIYGMDLLKETTLKSLGLTGGRAILRLIHRTPEQLKTQANISTPIPQKVKDDITFETTSTFKNVPKDKPIESFVKNIVSIPSNEITDNKVDDAIILDEKTVMPKNDDKSVENVEIEQSVMNMDVDVKVDSKTEDCLMQVQTPEEEINVIEDEECTEEVVMLGERNALVFSQDMATGLPFDDLPDEFYDLSVTEVKKLFIELKKKREELENAMLKTSALRNLETNEKKTMQMRKNEKVVLRILFPDRTVLQGTFVPIDTIETVKDFVKIYLQNEDEEFYLYTTPPKQILESESTLFDCQCIPSALLHFGPCNVDLVSSLSIQYLKSEILAKLTSPKAAMQYAAKSRGIKNVPQKQNISRTFANEAKTITENETFNKNQSMGASGPSKQKNSNVPKWFKPNTK